MARHAELESLAERLGATLVASSTAGWGDARVTTRVVRSDARVVAARRLSGPTAHSDARRMAAVMGRLRDNGIPVPPADAIEDASGSLAWLVTAWVEGDTGAAWLESPDRARHLAGRMGELAARLATVDGSGLGLDARAPPDGDVAALARRQLETVSIDDDARRALEPHLERLAAEPDRPAVFVHGDFAPINVVIDAGGEVVALLDVEHARLAPPRSDAAWWGWVVGHHHPEAWTAAGRTFLAAAGIRGVGDEERLGAPAFFQLLAWAATSSDPAAR